MTHVVIIRMHYKVGDPRFELRLDYFKKRVLTRLLAQTDQDFDIAIRCRIEHAEILKSLSPKIKTFQVKNEKEESRVMVKKKYFIDFVRWSDVIGLEKYDIQSGLDSDDLIAPNYIEMIKKEIEKNDPKKSLHISFQEEIFNAITGEIYPMTVKYGPNRGSAFFSIYQPNKKNYIFAYEFSHLTLGKHFQKSITLPEGFCWASVHGNNYSTNYAK